MGFRTLTTILLLCWAGTLAWSQHNENSAANNAFENGNYTEAAAQYEKEAIEKSSAEIFYKAAQSWSLAKEPNNAVQMLDSAFQYGYGNIQKVLSDPTLKAINRLPEFNRLISAEIEFSSDTSITMTDILIALRDRKVVKLESVAISNEFDEFYAGPYDVNMPLANPEIQKIPLTADSLFDFSDRALHITNCKGKIHLEGLKLKELNIITEEDLNPEKEEPSYQDWDVIALYDLQIGEFNYDLNGYHFIRFRGVNATKIPVYGISNTKILEYDSCKLTIDYTFFKDGSFPYYPIGSKEDKIESINIRSTEFLTSPDTNANISYITPLELHGTSIIISRSTFHDEVSFLGSSWDGIKLIDNDFKHPVDFSDAFFPEFNNYLPFDQFKKGFGVWSSQERDWEVQRKKFLITGESDEINDRISFHQLTNSYQFQYNNYRSRGEIYSANSAYMKMKDIVLRREKYLFDQEPTFQRYMRYQIGRLLKYYTDHGTNPAKAIVISIYIILLFSIMYTLFPSEWDKKSLKRLRSSFNEFRKVKGAKKFYGFLLVFKALIISWINAIFLSLNAFVTLGFGAVPTKGVARYLCILQGFIGWFLLSIFTVALINQVLQ